MQNFEDKMKYLYLDGSCGISGDMTVAALLDLGASCEKLEAAIAALHLEGVHTHIEKSNSYSIAGLSFDVHVHDHSADHVHAHEEAYVEHHHEHSHEHHHHHEHRHLSEVMEIIDHAAIGENAPLTANARKIAYRIFEIIAQAEAKAHGVAIEEVHFHEVGAIDSIIDILSVAVLADDLGIENVIVTGLNEGTGFVQTQHGMLPIPVPAVSNIAETASIALHTTESKGEMVTPTGIAIVAALRTSEKLPANYKILKSGIGLGKRDFGRANFLRAQIIEDCTDAGDTNFACSGNTPNDRNVFVIEANIDDSTSEELGYAMDKIFEAGARDVHFIPCYMKKNRPGVLLRAIADKHCLVAVETAIFKHTTTVGLRRMPVERTCMSRTIEEAVTPYGKVRIKKSSLGDMVKIKPEFEDIKAIAEKTGHSIRDVQETVMSKKEKP